MERDSVFMSVMKELFINLIQQVIVIFVLFLLVGDTKYLFTVAADSHCKIWEVNTGKCIKDLALESPVRCVAVSEEDKYLCLCTLNFNGIPVRRNSVCLGYRANC